MWKFQVCLCAGRGLACPVRQLAAPWVVCHVRSVAALHAPSATDGYVVPPVACAVTCAQRDVEFGDLGYVVGNGIRQVKPYGFRFKVRLNVLRGSPRGC